jgi:CRISPR system Cascade subunit CasC
MFIEVHLIQNFAPSNLNRDDTNNPKDCVFGGVRRARISSQCFKRAIRLDTHFEKLTQVPTSYRTRLMADEIRKALLEKKVDENLANEKSEIFAKHYSSKKAKIEERKTAVMLFVSKFEIGEIAEKLLELEKEDQIKAYSEEFAKNVPNRPGAPDIALFGRMLADRPETNVDAACQVAHAISTHSVSMDIDFFTALDDLQTDDVTGAGMMGVMGFNSACFYRYACIDFEKLCENLNGDVALAKRTVEGFLVSSIFAIPTGKQNSYAAHNLPSFVMVNMRENGECWSLANAFEKPVNQLTKKGLVQESVQALDNYWAKMTKFYGNPGNPVVACIADENSLNSLKDYQVDTLQELVEEVIQKLPKE